MIIVTLDRHHGSSIIIIMDHHHHHWSSLSWIIIIVDDDHGSLSFPMSIYHGSWSSLSWIIIMVIMFSSIEKVQCYGNNVLMAQCSFFTGSSMETPWVLCCQLPINIHNHCGQWSIFPLFSMEGHCCQWHGSIVVNFNYFPWKVPGSMVNKCP